MRNLVVLLMIGTIFLIGCGQKGPLVIPQSPDEVVINPPVDTDVNSSEPKRQ